MIGFSPRCSSPTSWTRAAEIGDRDWHALLVDKKLYLSSGVVAAFECKNTLKARQVADAAATALFVKSKIARRLGALQSELRAPLVYGLLAPR